MDPRSPWKELEPSNGALSNQMAMVRFARLEELALSRSTLPWLTLPWYQNLASQRTQYSTISCIFLREELLGLLGIFTKLFLRFEDLYILSGPLDKVDEINMFP